MKPIKAAIFDMDGTILDSMGIWAKIDIDFLNARGLEVPDDYMEKVGPHVLPGDGGIHHPAFSSR